MAVFSPIRRCATAAVWLLMAGGTARAGGATAGSTGTHAVSAEQLRADVRQLQGLTTACAAEAVRCDVDAVPSDERVSDADHGYDMHWDWLRMALKKARDAKAEDRHTLMSDAQSHLEELDRQLGGAGQGKDFAKARAEADHVLQTPEFENADGPTWWDRKKAQMYGWLARFFNGVETLGSMAPWIGKLLEWLLFLGAAVGLVIFLLRTLARQRMRIALEKAAPAVTAWQRESTDWAQMAERHAAEAEWREAVHCLYWASIVLLEGRRAWRHNPTRTPREYVRLLKPNSLQQQGLRGLTQVFERVWYGQREAERGDFERAQASFKQLERGADAALSAGRTGTAGAAA